VSFAIGKYYPSSRINGIFFPFQSLLEKLFSTSEEQDEAERIALQLSVPSGDALHAVLARNHRLILVTRDNHFKKLTHIASYWKPERLL